MRIRTVKPEWLEDERMAMASDAARVMSIGLILLADDYGRGRANPIMLGSRIFPRDSRVSREAFAELSEMGFLALYEVRGQKYFAIRNWSKHQKVDHPGAPRVPCPCGILDKSHECLANFPESLAPDPDQYPDQDQDPDLSCAPDEPGARVTPEDLERVYQKYPRKKGKSEGLKKARQKIRTADSLAQLENSVEQMALLWRGADTKYCPYWSTFISQDVWKDDELPGPTDDHGQQQEISI